MSRCARSPYRQAMEIDNQTEATMSDITAPRYGYDPKVAFAATRSCAERRARDSAAAVPPDEGLMRPAQRLIRRLASHLVASTS